MLRKLGAKVNFRVILSSLFKKVTTQNFCTAIKPQEDYKNYDFRFECLQLSDQITNQTIEEKIFKVLKPSETIEHAINLISAGFMNKSQQSIQIGLNHLTNFEQNIETKHVLMLICLLEDLTYYQNQKGNNKPIFGIEFIGSISEITQKLTKKHIDSDKNVFINYRLKSALDQNCASEVLVPVSDVINQIKSIVINPHPEYISRFQMTISVLNYYFFNVEHKKQEQLHDSLRELLLFSFKTINQSQLLKLLTFCDLENELFDATLIFELEKVIADAFFEELSVKWTEQMLDVLTNNPFLFRQKLFMTINKNIQPIFSKFNFKAMTNLLFLNFLMKLNVDFVIDEIEIDTIAMGVASQGIDAIIRFKAMQMEDYANTGSTKSSIDSIILKFDFNAIKAHQLYKLLMISFYEQNEEMFQKINEELIKSEKFDYRTAGDIVLEVGYLWECQKLSEVEFEKYFKRVFDFFVQEIRSDKNMSLNKKLAFRDQISQITDIYDEQLDNLN